MVVKFKGGPLGGPVWCASERGSLDMEGGAKTQEEAGRPRAQQRGLGPILL